MELINLLKRGSREGLMFYQEDSLGVVVVDPEEEVAAVIASQARCCCLGKAGGEVVVVQSSIEVEDIHGGGIAVHHRSGHGQQVLLYAPPQAAHLHMYMRLTPGTATSTREISPLSLVVRTTPRLLLAPWPMPVEILPSFGAMHCEC